MIRIPGIDDPILQIPNYDKLRKVLSHSEILKIFAGRGAQTKKKPVKKRRRKPIKKPIKKPVKRRTSRVNSNVPIPRQFMTTGQVKAAELEKHGRTIRLTDKQIAQLFNL